MRTTIRRGVPGSGIEAALPGLYRPLLRAGMRRMREAHLLLFPQQGVTTSTAARRALTKLASIATAPSFAFAYDATDEARELLEAAGVRVLTLRSSGWSDARYQSIKEHMGS